MIGQFSNLSNLFNPSRRASSRQSTIVESVTEDQHTRSLLFPEVQLLNHYDGHAYPLANDLALGCSASLHSYDGVQNEIDIDQSKDIRILVAQGDCGSHPKTILFDSKPSASRTSSPTHASNRRPSQSSARTERTGAMAIQSSAAHLRRSSLSSESTMTPRAPGITAFQRARTRAASTSSSPFLDEASKVRSKDSDDIIETALDCMFGNVPMAYRGTSHKLHIVPLEPRPIDQVLSRDILREGFGSLNKSEGRKRSHLATSYTPSDPLPDLPHAKAENLRISSKEPRRRTILVTRTFSVPLPEEIDGVEGSNQQGVTSHVSSGKANGSSYSISSSAKKAGSNRHLRLRRSPMYAVTIVIQLPVASASAMKSGIKPGQSWQKNPTYGSSFSQGLDSLGSSADSDRRSGWHIVDHEFGLDSGLSSSFSSDVDNRVESVGQHWDVFVRTLSSLQFIVQDIVLARFRNLATISPEVAAASERQERPVTGNRESSARPNFQASIRSEPLLLEAYALSFDPQLKKASDLASERLVRGMKTPRVVTGQNKWGVWREEAWWLTRWAGGREENFFLFNILTAFLGNHTEWLDALGPKVYRQRHREQQKALVGEDLTISTRTVIVSTEKMAARRLIYLLATFLPSSLHAGYDGASPVRPATSTSLRGYSQSPPTIALSRQQSLRRTINRRAPGNLTNNRASAFTKSSRASSDGIEDRNLSNEMSQSRQHSRRPSESRSFTSSLGVPPMPDNSVARKSSSATISTVTPDSTVPVAHFATQRTPTLPGTAMTRMDSSESRASANLLHALQRSQSGNNTASSTDTQNSSKWPNFMSFWSSGRRGSSDSQSDVLQSTDDGLGISGMTYRKPVDHGSPSKLDQMVRELEGNATFSKDDSLEEYDPSIGPVPDDQSAANAPPAGTTPTAARDIPSHARTKAAPIRMSVNEDDGIIDVEIPNLPGSPIVSPAIPGYISSPSLDGSSYTPSIIYPPFDSDSEQPVNVAGWLARFHPDFALQGINPYPDLEQDVRRAMSSEPTPVSFTMCNGDSGVVEKWVDVCSTLLADTRTFTVKRLKLRRLIRLIPVPSQSAPTPGPVPGRSQYGNPYSQGHLSPAMPMSELRLEECFNEEPIMDIDEVLEETITNLLNQGSRTPRAHSKSSSRSSSRRGRKDRRSGSDATSTPVLEPRANDASHTVLGALEQLAIQVHSELKGDTSKPEAAETQVSEEQDTKPANPKLTSDRDSTLREGIRSWLRGIDET